MKILLVLPIIVPFSTAIFSLLAWKNSSVQRILNAAGASVLLISALGLLYFVWSDGIQCVHVGYWPAPFGIALVADLFSATMIVMTGMVGLAVAVFSLATIDSERETFGYYPIYHTLLMGVCGSFITGDIFNLFVWFEVMLIASFVLLGLGGEKAQLEGSVKYVTLNLLASALFLAAVGGLYGVAGTLNMADLAVQLRAVQDKSVVTTLAMLLLIAFGIKAAIFPLFFWLPASYHTPPVAVSAVFAGLLTKVGVYAIIRVFTLLFVHDMEFTHKLILILAGLTMVTGVLGAAAQIEFRRILSFHIISQIGYMILGLGLFTRLAVAGSVFYIVHHIIVKTNLFLISGVVYHLRATYDLKRLGGLYASSPILSVLFLIPALSLAGVPPLSGFWGKFVLARAGFDTGEYVIVAVALLVGLLTLFSMTKIWAEAFWKAPPDGVELREVDTLGRIELRTRLYLLIPVILLALVTVMIGLFTEPLIVLSSRAAEQLMNPEEYIQAVLKGVH